MEHKYFRNYVIILSYLLMLISSVPSAQAFVTPGKVNVGTVAVKSSSGTIPGIASNVYSAMEGDEITYSIGFRRLLNPDYLDIELGQGIDFQEIAETAVFDDNPFAKMDWEAKEIECAEDNTVRIDLSDLPDQVELLTIQIRCSATQQLAEIYEGSAIKAVLFEKQSSVPQEFSSPKIYGMHMQIKTAGTDADGVKYRLYYDENMLNPVSFFKNKDSYTACMDSDNTALYDLFSESEVITLL